MARPHIERAKRSFLLQIRPPGGGRGEFGPQILYMLWSASFPLRMRSLARSAIGKSSWRLGGNPHCRRILKCCMNRYGPCVICVMPMLTAPGAPVHAFGFFGRPVGRLPKRLPRFPGGNGAEEVTLACRLRPLSSGINDPQLGAPRSIIGGLAVSPPSFFEMLSLVSLCAFSIRCSPLRPHRARPDVERPQEPGELRLGKPMWLLLAILPTPLGPG
jgi:hypothetical protein